MKKQNLNNKNETDTNTNPISLIEGIAQAADSNNPTNPDLPANGKSGIPFLDNLSNLDPRGIGVNTTLDNFNINEYSKYYKPGAYINPLTADSHRAYNQSGWEQAGNAVTKLLPNIGLNILEQIGYAFDIEDYANSNNEVGNWLSTWARKNIENINSNNPIYRENPDTPLDFGDSGWWFENGSSLVESATAFIATAYLTRGASLKMLNNGNRALKWLGFMGMESQTLNKASILASTLMLNQA